ncbi:MAG: phytoene desaturase family protein [Pseudomonadota bacterium]
MTSEKPKIVIIGAGIGGLTAASVLSRSAKVSVIERGEACGGKIREITIDNQPIDSGPTVFTLRSVFDDIFKASGAALDDYLELRKVECLSRNYWNCGGTLDLFSDAEETAGAIARFSSPAEAERYRAFVKDAERAWHTLYGPFMRRKAPNFFSLMAGAGPLALTRLDPYTSLWRTLEKRFTDKRLQQLFGRYATYCGSSPFEASATLMLIAHVERMGVFAPVGGMAALAKALERRATENGAEFHYKSDVAAVEYKGGQLVSVRTSDGQQYAADAVLFNGDLGALQNQNTKHAKSIELAFSKQCNAVKPMKKRSQSALTWSFLGKASKASKTSNDRNPPALSLHNVFFSDNYRAEFDDVFERRRCPENPTVYLFAPDRAPHQTKKSINESIDNSMQVSGSDSDQTLNTERFFCLINAPAIGEERDFPAEEIEQCRMQAMAQLERCGITLHMAPEKTQVQTPNDFAKRFPATNGALFGNPNHGWRTAFQRQGVKSPHQGLYFAGGSVHPGSGVPMAALSGLMAAQTITKDYALT